jgi:hypothetical protein
MNERIKELVKQCHKPVITDGSRYLGETFDHEKFAELIVNECAEFLMDDGAVEAVAYRLKKHFGVEHE